MLWKTNPSFLPGNDVFFKYRTIAWDASSGIRKDNGSPVFSCIIWMYSVLRSTSDRFSFAISPERSPMRVASLMIARSLFPVFVAMSITFSTQVISAGV